VREVAAATGEAVRHWDSHKLARGMAKCQPVAWVGTLYRTCSPRYANKDDLLTGAGSKSAGGRWNPPNSFRTVYTSLDPHTAIDEALAHFIYYRLPTAQAMPRILVSLKARVRRVLDLTDGVRRRLLGVSEKRLLREPWREEQEKGREALTQAIGRLAFDSDWEGLLVPSAVHTGGRNLIVFPANLNAPKSWVAIINKSDLPRRF
jgi:RES domain-containing protein